jgi:hypothetical protein
LTPHAPHPKPRRLAIIGTAGRDESRPMTAALWRWMVADAKSRVRPDDIAVSGGAAWADHLAVRLFLDGDVAGLTLHLPAPFRDGRFEGDPGTSGARTNELHARFSHATGIDSLAELALAIAKGARASEQPVAPGSVGNLARNRLVAREADAALAYTFGRGVVPAEGGTKDTWDKLRGVRVHVPLPDFQPRA